MPWLSSFSYLSKYTSWPSSAAPCRLCFHDQQLSRWLRIHKLWWYQGSRMWCHLSIRWTVRHLWLPCEGRQVRRGLPRVLQRHRQGDQSDWQGECRHNVSYPNKPNQSQAECYSVPSKHPLACGLRGQTDKWSLFFFVSQLHAMVCGETFHLK